MTTADAWTYAAPGSAYRPADGWSSRTRYAPTDFVTLLWRERFLMGGIFVALFALGLAFAFTLKTSYEARTSISVRLGQEYVYQPRAGDAGRGAVPDNDTIVQSEVTILTSRALKERVIEKIGLSQIYPKIADGKTGDAHAFALDKAVRAMDKALAVESGPDNPTINLAFKHENPQVAARVLNTLLDEYLLYRQTALMESNAPALQAQRQISEQKLAAADAALEAFTTFNNIGDFETDKQSYNQLKVQLDQQRYTTTSDLAANQARLRAFNSQLAGMSAEQALYRDLDMTTNVERNALLAKQQDIESRFLPNSPEVIEIRARIADFDRSKAGSSPRGDTARRMGPDPRYQTLQTERAQLIAQVDGQKDLLASVNAQIAQITERQMQLAQLEPRYQALVRERGILQQNVTDFTTREQEALANEAIAGKGASNISIYGRAVAPTQGSSLKKPVAILALLFAGFTALCAGLLHIFLRPGVSTPLSAGRTLDLPVLGTARVKR